MIVDGKLATLQRALDAARHAGGVLAEARALLDAYEEDAPSQAQATSSARSEAIAQIEAAIFNRFGRF